MKDTKERLVAGAFKLFLLHNFEKVTIADIEKETGISRGSIFYNFATKQDVFNHIIDTYIFEAQNLTNKIGYCEYASFSDFLKQYIMGINKTMAIMCSFSIVNIYKHYFSLIIQASKYYPNFQEKLNRLREGEYNVWKDVITKAIANKELKKDIDVEYTIIQFRSVFLGVAFEQSLYYGLDVDWLYEYFQYMYKKIKA
ncbi:MAG: TetR/AcrR family transcriptional regulator [Bacteroidales bacterium]